jgi:hypothetical protein
MKRRIAFAVTSLMLLAEGFARVLARLVSSGRRRGSREVSSYSATAPTIAPLAHFAARYPFPAIPLMALREPPAMSAFAPLLGDERTSNVSAELRDFYEYTTY